jgi:hypothetical protein
VQSSRYLATFLRNLLFPYSGLKRMQHEQRILLACLLVGMVYSSNLNMEAVPLSETSVYIYQITGITFQHVVIITVLRILDLT